MYWHVLSFRVPEMAQDVGILLHGHLTRYAKLRVAHAPGMSGTFSPPPWFSDPDMHHGKCATHVPWCMSGSLTSDFLWSRWREKGSRHSRRMRNPQFSVSVKRPMEDEDPFTSYGQLPVVVELYHSLCIARLIGFNLYHNKRKHTPSTLTPPCGAITWLLRAWRCKEPQHQYPCYWPSFSEIRKMYLGNKDDLVIWNRRTCVTALMVQINILQ